MRFDRLRYRDPRPVPWLIRAAGVFNRHVILPRVLRIARIDLPAADEARLRAAVHPGSAAFLGPNHPEFMTDWMLDKEIAHRVSPYMAHWASWEIVNVHPLAQRFWLALNLIANVPGGGGRARSREVARAGHGVLLHPEGTATWCAARVGRLVPGIAAMAIDAWDAEQAEPSGPGGARRTVWIVPVVWRLHFTSDVSHALDREIDGIARALALHLPPAPLEVRFAALHGALLAARARRFGVAPGRFGAAGFFSAQQDVARALIAQLAVRHGRPGEEIGRWLHGVRRRCRRADARANARDLALAREIDRLHRFTAETHDGPALAQEQIAESLQQIRSSLITRGWRNALHNLVPVAVAPRIARIRVPEPIGVDGRLDADALLTELRRRMQDGLDALGVEIARETERYARPNPFSRDRSSGGTPATAPLRPGTRVTVVRAGIENPREPDRLVAS